MTGDLCSCLAIKSGCLEVEGLDTQHLDDTKWGGKISAIAGQSLIFLFP